MMKMWAGRLALLLLVGLAAGCGNSGQEGGRMAVPAMPSGPAATADLAQGEPARAGQADTPRYLAERQHWLFELAEEDVERRWQAHLDLCKAGCEVLSAALNKSAHAPVGASLELRVVRAGAERLFAAMTPALASERRVEREDKTLEVVDVEARLKNQADLRDRLRALLAGRPGGLKDVLETERELARVQGELDALASRRKVLANETEKIFLRAEYRPRPSIAETGVFAPLAEAWHGSGRAFAESLAAALTFLVQVLPWLVIVLPALWGAWRLARRLMDRLGRRRTAEPPAHG